MRPHGCTIVAGNYLAHARIVARTFLEHHPNGRFTVLALDGPPPRLETDGFEVVEPHDIFEEREFARMATMYSVIELATAVKPTLLRKLIADGSRAVLYLDPDIEVFAPLTEICDLAAEHGIVLTPHLTEPHPRWDDLVPTEDIVLGAGIYNLGFVGVGSSATAFLDWWIDCLARECVIDVPRSRFVDQRWMDLAPGYFGAHIVRDPGLNSAWWNLPKRTITQEADGYRVNGSALRFMHFSGYDPTRPHLLSKHQGRFPRVILSQRPDLMALCRRYREQLIEAGFLETSRRPYGYQTLPSGAAIDQRMREAYRQALVLWERFGKGEEPPCPFVPGEEAAFLSWVNNRTAQQSRRRLRRYLRRLWRDRRELPHSVAGQSRGLATRARLRSHPTSGVRSDASEADSDPVPDPNGVNVAGYFRSELGVGEAARLVLGGIEAAEIPHSTVLYDRTPSRQGHAFSQNGRVQLAYRTNVICVNADQLPHFLNDVGPNFSDGRINVGVWWWEVAEFPREYMDRFALVDEIWVGSEFIADTLQRATDLPVYVMPLPVTLRAAPLVDRAQLQLTDAFTFLFSFDFFSVFERKNPLAVIEAFTRAFRPGDGPRLVIKSINGDAKPAELQRLHDAAAAHPEVTVWDGYVDAEIKDALMAATDCYVSLHRSEGFGLTMAEAMSYGKPVIATGYSGNLAFMDSTNSYLVPYSLTSVPRGCPPYPASAEWAEPDIHEAARLMRHVFENPVEAEAIGKQARQDLAETRSAGGMGAFVKSRLDALQTQIPKTKARPTAIRDRSLPRRAARRALWRALRPYADIIESQCENLDFRITQTDYAVKHISEALDALQIAISTTSDAGTRLLQELTPWPYVSDPSLVRYRTSTGAEVLGFESTAQIPVEDAARYRLFEDVFRGSEDFVQERQRYYLKLLERRHPVLDVGCGRGEFLDLLREEGIPAKGVDLDEGMVAHCIQKGHDVELGDGLEILAGQPDGSLGTIFCAQVIEHLPLDDLTTLFDLARRKLVPGGMLIAETVNPHALPAFKTFWVDPTHKIQIFPEVAVTLCRAAGFARCTVVFPQGSGELEVDRLRCGEYAITAVTSAPDGPGVDS